MNERTGDILAGVAGIAFAAFLFASSLTFPEPGPKWMPWFVTGLIGVGSIVLIIRRLRDPAPGERLFSDVHWKALLVLVGGWVAMVLLLERVGFYFMMMLFMAGMSWFLRGSPRKPGPILGSAVYGILTGLVMWGVFTFLLGTRTPAGWTF